MVEPAYTIFEPAAGTGMLGVAVKLALEVIGVRAVVVGGCERESCAVSAFMASMEHEEGRGGVIWDDANTFLGRRARGLERVHAVVGGYPCQPFSLAGRRDGHRDERHLWPAVRRIVARLEPELVFFENVEGHVSMGLWKVLRDLERLGYRVTSGVFSAEEVGAPHLRKRVFILGVADTGGIGGWKDKSQWEPHQRATTGRGSEELGNTARRRKRSRSGEQDAAGSGGESGSEVAGDELANQPGERRPRDTQQDVGPIEGGQPAPRRGDAGGCNGELALGPSGGCRTLRESSDRDGQPDGSYGQLADPEHIARSTEHEQTPGERTDSGATDRPVHGACCEDVGNASGQGLQGPERTELRGSRRRDEGGATIESGSPLFPPGRTDYAEWARLVAEGLGPSRMPAIESGVPVVADGMATPADILRLGGNGVVPLQAAWAFLSLYACLMEPMEGTGEDGATETDRKNDLRQKTLF